MREKKLWECYLTEKGGIAHPWAWWPEPLPDFSSTSCPAPSTFAGSFPPCIVLYLWKSHARKDATSSGNSHSQFACISDMHVSCCILSLWPTEDVLCHMVAGSSREEFLLQYFWVGPCLLPLCEVGHETVIVKTIAITLWTLFWKAAIQDIFPASFSIFPDLCLGFRADIYGYFTQC